VIAVRHLHGGASDHAIIQLEARRRQRTQQATQRQQLGERIASGMP
jgi:hypothetical protein